MSVVPKVTTLEAVMRRTVTYLFALAFLRVPVHLAGCDKARELIDTVKKAGKPDEPPKRSGGVEKADVKADVKTDAKKVAIIVAHDGYEDSEFKVSMKKFEEAGFTVEVVSLFLAPATGALGGKTAVDLTLNEAAGKVGEYDAVVLIGGPGSTVYHNDKTAHKMVKEAVKSGKVVAAICLAPFTLSNAGVLGGVKATVWTGGRFTTEAFMKGGAFYRDEPVVVDGKLVTANGPPAAKQFAAEIVKLLK